MRQSNACLSDILDHHENVQPTRAMVSSDPKFPMLKEPICIGVIWRLGVKPQENIEQLPATCSTRLENTIRARHVLMSSHVKVGQWRGELPLESRSVPRILARVHVVKGHSQASLGY